MTEWAKKSAFSGVSFQYQHSDRAAENNKVPSDSSNASRLDRSEGLGVLGDGLSQRMPGYRISPYHCTAWNDSISLPTAFLPLCWRKSKLNYDNYLRQNHYNRRESGFPEWPIPEWSGSSKIPQQLRTQAVGRALLCPRLPLIKDDWVQKFPGQLAGGLWDWRGCCFSTESLDEAPSPSF